jgi:hypothetical protein
MFIKQTKAVRLPVMHFHHCPSFGTMPLGSAGHPVAELSRNIEVLSFSSSTKQEQSMEYPGTETWRLVWDELFHTWYRLHCLSHPYPVPKAGGEMKFAPEFSNQVRALERDTLA